MRSFARNIGGQVPNTILAQDISSNGDVTFSDEAVSLYLNVLKKIFVVENMPSWNPNLRSNTAIGSSDTLYYVDPSIALASLGLGRNDLINDLRTFGFLFESLCIRNLRIFADSLNGSVYHYRDKDDLECDAVVQLKNGKYGLIEIELGGDSYVEEGVKNLVALKIRSILKR